MTPLVIDPSLFHADAVDPTTAAFNAEVEAALRALPRADEIGAAETRARRRRGEGLLGYQPADPAARWEMAQALGREVPVRVFRPKAAARGVYLHIHGGGHTLGAADAQDQTLRSWANDHHLAVVSVEYRLAPEHPWPAGPDDCETAAMWLTENSQQLFGTQNLVIGGESAGAHLSAVTLVRLRGRLGRCPFVFADLVYGIFDLAGTPSMLGWGERNLVINTPLVRWFVNNLLPELTHNDAARRAPDLSPLYADLRGLCPAHFTLGTLDPLVDDTLLMAQRWGAAGNPASLSIWPGGIHAFTLVPGLALAQAANARIFERITDHFA